jgi:uncharacterized protein (DUF2147 family)
MSAFLLPLLLAAAPQAPSPIGTWRNAGDSVRIRVAPCGAALCGTVVAASERARADAADGGTERLIGTRTLDGFRRTGEREWTGEAFVPDLAVTVEGTMTLESRDTMVVAGCLFGGLGCREQRWNRVK